VKRPKRSKSIQPGVNNLTGVYKTGERRQDKAAIVLLVLVPQLVLFLPNAIFGR